MSVKVASSGKSTAGSLQEADTLLSLAPARGWQCVMTPRRDGPSDRPSMWASSTLQPWPGKPFPQPSCHKSQRPLQPAYSLPTVRVSTQIGHLFCRPRVACRPPVPTDTGSHYMPMPPAWSLTPHQNSGGCGLLLAQQLQTSSSLAKPVHIYASCWADHTFSSEIIMSSQFVLGYSPSALGYHIESPYMLWLLFSHS